MLTSILNVLFALVVTLFATDSTAAEMHWGDFKKDHCTSTGTRQYSAILWDIPWGQSWDDACKAKPATVKGHTFSAPSRCKNTGNMWGEFDVPDSSCGTKWGDWRKERCVSFTQVNGPNVLGYRQYASVLWDIPAGADWIGMCQKTPVTLTVDGSSKNFPTPHVCALADSDHVTHAVTTGIVIGITVAAAVATGGPGGAVGPAIAPFALGISKEVAKHNPLNVWGNVFIPDNTCNVNNSTAISLPEAAKGLVVPK
jgi:hypothetical protein